MNGALPPRRRDGRSALCVLLSVEIGCMIVLICVEDAYTSFSKRACRASPYDPQSDKRERVPDGLDIRPSNILNPNADTLKN